MTRYRIEEPQKKNNFSPNLTKSGEKNYDGTLGNQSFGHVLTRISRINISIVNPLTATVD